MAPQQPNEGEQEVFSVGFRNGALAKIKELATKLGISHDDLGEVLIKGVKLIDLSSGGKIIIEKGDERLEVDLKTL